MPLRRDPNFLTGHLCRFCGQPVPWGEMLRLLRVDPETPPYMTDESACHADCLARVLPPAAPLTLHRHWNGKRPLLDDSADVDGQPCAMCGRAIAAPDLVRLRVQRPAGTVKAPEFDEQTLPLHADCLAAVSNSKLF